MRSRLTAALAALAITGFAGGVTPPEALAEKTKTSCSDYCGEKPHRTARRSTRGAATCISPAVSPAAT